MAGNFPQDDDLLLDLLHGSYPNLLMSYHTFSPHSQLPNGRPAAPTPLQYTLTLFYSCGQVARPLGLAGGGPEAWGILMA